MLKMLKMLSVFINFLHQFFFITDFLCVFNKINIFNKKTNKRITMKTLADRHKYWAEKLKVAKDERAKKIAQSKIAEIEADAKKQNFNLENLFSSQNEPVQNAVQIEAEKMETLSEKNEILNPEKVLEMEQEIIKIKRIFKTKVMELDTKEYLYELERKVLNFHQKQKTTPSQTNRKFITETGEVGFIDLVKEEINFENGITYTNEELTHLKKVNASKLEFQMIHLIKNNFKAEYVN